MLQFNNDLQYKPCCPSVGLSLTSWPFSGTINDPEGQSGLDELIFLADVLLTIKKGDLLFVRDQSDMLGLSSWNWNLFLVPKFHWTLNVTLFKNLLMFSSPSYPPTPPLIFKSRIYIFLWLPWLPFPIPPFFASPESSTIGGFWERRYWGVDCIIFFQLTQLLCWYISSRTTTPS